jgi:hypothetical protein
MHEQRMKFSDELNHVPDNARKELAKAGAPLNGNILKFEARGADRFPSDCVNRRSDTGDIVSSRIA